MWQTVHSVLGIQQRTWLLISTEAYNLLEKRTTNKGDECYKGNRFRTSKEIIRGIYKKIYVTILLKLKFQKCQIVVRFPDGASPTKQLTQYCDHVFTLLHCSMKFHQQKYPSNKNIFIPVLVKCNYWEGYIIYNSVLSQSDNSV